MTVTELSIQDAYLVTDKFFEDSRGRFTEAWENTQFKKNNIDFSPSNSCFSYNTRKFTLRGLHYQQEPFGQSKLVTCVAGSIYDVILDLRKSSAGYLKWQAIEIKAFTGKAVFIPKGCAHGFVTLEENVVVSYLIEGDYNAGAAKAVRWNDPAIKINWPTDNPVISEKDSNADLITL